MAKSGVVDDAADELYGLPPGEFTRARDERAKKLRGGGEREAANAVKALRRPTVAAWALNQLARRRAKDLDKLLSAGEDLRAAQEELLAGGDRSAFQDAAARERELVAKLAADATTMASEAGERGGGLQEKVAATLHAAALDEETAEELRTGRLVKEREAIGGFGAMAGTPAPAAPATGRKASASGRQARAASGRGRRADSPAPAASPSARSSSRAESSSHAGSSPQRAEDAQRRQRLTAARTDERHARRELEAAERAVKHAEERAEAAEAHAREAGERARTTADRLKEAKRAQTAARKAHARAERALAKADDGAS